MSGQRKRPATAANPDQSQKSSTDLGIIPADRKISFAAPYPGLRAFDSSESSLFFGRDTSVDQMIDRLARTRFLAVLGASGSGKSSLVKAGLYTGLRLGLHPKLGGQWQIAELKPGRKPIHNLAAALAAHAPEDTRDIDLLVAHLNRGPRSMIEVVSSGLIREGHNLLIVVDQFEELFRFRGYAEREETEAFVALLLETIKLDLPVQVVLTMRSEYLGACSLFPDLAEMISDGLFLTPSMTRAGCREAIAGPQRIGKFKVETALASRLLNDIQSFSPFEGSTAIDQAEVLALQADLLPLMQHVLNRMYLQVKNAPGADPADILLTDDGYTTAGGLTGAIEKHGNEILARLVKSHGPDVEKTIERIFRALVDGLSLNLAVRRPRRLAQLVEDGGADRATTLAIVSTFSAEDCNFLRTSEPDIEDGTIIDLSHESLIRRWPKLGAWFEKEINAANMWQRFANATEDTPMIRGATLHRINDWWLQENPLPSSAARYGKNYAELDRHLRDSLLARLKVKKLKRLTISLATLSLIIVVAGITSIIFYNKSVMDQAAFQAESVNRTRYELLILSNFYLNQLCPPPKSYNDQSIYLTCVKSYSRQVSTINNGPGSTNPSMLKQFPGMGGITEDQVRSTVRTK